MEYYFFKWYWILVTNILCSLFTSVFMSDNSLQFFSPTFWGESSSGLGIKIRSYMLKLLKD